MILLESQKTEEAMLDVKLKMVGWGFSVNFYCFFFLL